MEPEDLASCGTLDSVLQSMIRLGFLVTLVLRNFVHDTEFCTLLALFLGIPLWNLKVES